ncbi:hypothetical protein K4K56_006172 [Colletotrichum sp. SAR 10_98]|nr:hypothetical protein K4K56_006172 [Colletotrichum sp. SAR 10_98]
MAATQPHEEHKREIVENEHGNHAVHVEGDDYNEAMKIEEQSAPTWSKEEEGQALRKLDWNLIPLLGALYLVSYIDRGNIGNAYTAGMGEEWGITSEDYSWIVTILYIGYILFHWVSPHSLSMVTEAADVLKLILVWTFVPLPLWTALMAIGWGSISMLQAATHNFAGIMALRFQLLCICTGVWSCSASKRGAGLAIFGMVGQCGPILGARLFPKTDQPWYAKGMWTCAGILFAAAALATVLSLCLRLQNKKRDEKYGKSDLDYVPAEVADKGDDHPMYRYVL